MGPSTQHAGQSLPPAPLPWSSGASHPCAHAPRGLQRRSGRRRPSVRLAPTEPLGTCPPLRLEPV
eukprot:12054728-Alexandrium_andersonii.AAC.1